MNAWIPNGPWGLRFRELEPMTDDKRQWFTAIKDGQPVATFMVNHTYMPSATAYIAQARRNNIWDYEFDYVRSATRSETRAQ